MSLRHLAFVVIISTPALAGEDAGIDPADLLRRIEALEAELAKRPTNPPPPPPPTQTVPDAQPLDVTEPPFSKFDWSWLNGSNYQPASLLKIGPVVPTFFVDADYAWQFSNPADHTIFPTTTAARHSEFSLNLAYLGFELLANGIDTPFGGPIGRFEVQMGSYIATIHGQDATLQRGSFLSNPTLSYVKQAGAGWHFHWLHGVNIELGIFPSYIALESFTPQENWNYTHPFVSDFTPYYFSGLRTQLFLLENQKLELWLVNGWQSFGRWHDALTGGYLYNVRHSNWFSFTHTLYAGQEQTRASDPNSQSFRVYTDNYAQVLLLNQLDRGFFQRLALCLVADAGYEFRGPTAGEIVDGRRTPPNGPMVGGSLTLRAEWTRWLMTTLRGDVFYDRSSAVVYPLPLGNLYTLPGNGSTVNPFEFLGGGFTATIDLRPSPWLVLRVEYAHRAANQPYFSGPAGITGPNGLPPVDDAARAAFSPDLRTTDDRVVANVTLRM
ncbi:MAG: outer membrane beta-barrel protein [Archangium sp.]|nr:outer membrane beta-barrel protein [Archangium sp.]